MERIKVGLLAVIAACLLVGVASEPRIDLVTRADAQGPGAGPSVKCEAWEVQWSYKEDRARKHTEQMRSEMEARIKRFHEQGYNRTTFDGAFASGQTAGPAFNAILGVLCMSR